MADDNRSTDEPSVEYEMFPNVPLGDAPVSTNTNVSMAKSDGAAIPSPDATGSKTSKPSRTARGRGTKRLSPDRPSNADAASATSYPEGGAIVPMTSLIIHPDLSITVEEMIEGHGDAVEEAADHLRRGIAPVEPPQVTRLEDGRFGALTGLEWVTACSQHAMRHPDATIRVRIGAGIDPAAQVCEWLSSPRGRSGWEQYCGIRGLFEGGGVRDRLRALDLDVDKWESRVSKVLKVGRLPSEILETVVVLTIPVKEAGQIVDSWADEAKRSIMQALLAEARRTGNARLHAGTLFKSMLAAVRPEVVEPVWQNDTDGNRKFVAADGTLLATLSKVDDRWVAEGEHMTAAQLRAMTKGMADLLR